MYNWSKVKYTCINQHMVANIFIHGLLRFDEIKYTGEQVKLL